MKTLFLLAIVAVLGWLVYRRSHPSQAQEIQATAQKVDNAATRYVGSLQRDEIKAQQAVQKMNAGIHQAEKAAAQADQQ